MSYVPDLGTDYGNMQGTDFTAGTTGGQDEPLNLGPNIFLAKPGDLPPEAFQSRTPTVQHLPDKIVKTTLPPQHKTENLPPKIVKERRPPIFPPGQAPSALPNF